MDIKTRQFNSSDDLTAAAAELLGEQLRSRIPGLHGILLSGGRTPRPLYEQVAMRRIRVPDSLFLMVTDERVVPVTDAESNYPPIKAMASALLIPEERILRVHTELPLADAARRYHQELHGFLKVGGRIALGFLGLGADGHTASIFSEKDLGRGRGRYAMPVPCAQGTSRVSVTPELLTRAQLLVFLAVGAEKHKVFQTMKTHPERLPAGRAVAGAAAVQLWYAEK